MKPRKLEGVLMEREEYYLVTYQYGTYSGTRKVWATSQEQAIAIVKRELRPHMHLSMAHESYHAEAI